MANKKSSPHAEGILEGLKEAIAFTKVNKPMCAQPLSMYLSPAVEQFGKP